MKQSRNYYIAFLICFLFSSIISYGRNAPPSNGNHLIFIQNEYISNNEPSNNTTYCGMDNSQTRQINDYVKESNDYYVAAKTGLNTIFYTHNLVVTITIDSVTTIPPTSCGLSDGSITISASGGSGNYQYSIDCGANWQTSNIFTGLANGTYCIYVSNVGGSSQVGWTPVTLNAANSPVITNVASTNPTNCGVADGTITITATGSNGLEYSIDGGLTFSSSNVFTGLSSGTYQVITRYQNGTCAVTYPSSIILTSPVSPQINNVSFTNPTSCVNPNGTITITASGGIAPLEYSIDGGATWVANGGNFTTIGCTSYDIWVRNAGGSCLVHYGGLNIGVASPAPVAVDDHYTTTINTSISDNMLVNDFDPNGLLFSTSNIPFINFPTLGNVIMNPTGAFTYTPNLNAIGLDSFQYRINNGLHLDTGMVYINIIQNYTSTHYVNVGINSTELLCVDTIDLAGNFQTLVDLNSSFLTFGTSVINSQCIHYTAGNVTGGSDTITVVAMDDLGNHDTTIYIIDVIDFSLCDVLPDTIYANSTNCNHYIDICIPISPTTLLNYNAFVDGLFYNQTQGWRVTTCNDTIDTYDLNNLSMTGPWLVEWTPGNATNSSIISTFSELVDSMNSWQLSDPWYQNGNETYPNWTLNGNQISGYISGFNSSALILTNLFGTLSDTINYTRTINVDTSQSRIYVLPTTQEFVIQNGACTDTAQLSINCLAINNNHPIAVNDNYTTNMNTPLSNNVLTNDYDPDGNLVLNTTPITNTSNGIHVMNVDGSFTYIPNSSFMGIDSFSYQICDDGVPSLCDTGMVYINVIPLPLQITNVSVIDESCSQSNGHIDITAANGTGVYEYSIDSQQTWQSNNYFGNLSAGVYYVFVRDGQDTVAYVSNPITIYDTVAPIFVNAYYNHDSLVINATATQPIQYSIDCGATWQNSNVFYPASTNNLCVGIQLSSGSCPIFPSINLNNNPPIAVADSVTFPQGGYQTLNVLQNDYDLENNALFIVPQTNYYGLDSLTLDSNGIMNVPTEAWNFGSYMIPYQVCEVYNPSNCSQGNAYITITPPTQIYYDTMAIGATHTFCIPNNLPGTPISGIVISSFTNNLIDSININCLYIYGDNYGTDTAIIVLCDNLGFCDTTILYLNVLNGVWPGDTDDDTYVDNFDLLNIGLGYGKTGTPRNVITNVWNGYVTPFWNIASPISNIDYRHADSDGDGIVDDLDTIAIIQNYGKSYQKGGTSFLGNIPIQVGNDTANTFPKYSLPILLGDALNPVSGLYGGAFSISYDTSIIKTNSIYISFDTTWVGTKGIDLISIQKNLPNNNQIDAALTRIDGNNVNGYGLIAKLNFTIKDDILQRPVFGTDSIWTQFNIFDTKFIRNDETLIGVDELNSTILITSVDKVQPTINHLVDIFPNPTKDFVNISTQNLNVKHISISDMTGKTILFEYGNYGNLQKINISTLPNGVYNVLLQTDKGVAVKRLTILK